METKDIFTMVIIASVVFLGLNCFSQPDENLGGQIFVTQPSFKYGFKVAGTEMVDESRNIAAGTITASTVTGTGELTATGVVIADTTSSTLEIGSAIANGHCIQVYASEGVAYVVFATSSGDGSTVVTSTKPANCK